MFAFTRPGPEYFSVLNVYLGAIFKGKKFPFNTLSNGGHRAIVPVGSYEKVMPLDTEPTYLMRALVSDDDELAISLGALELDSEDLALCTYVCPSKNEYGNLLERLHTDIIKEGLG